MTESCYTFQGNGYAMQQDIRHYDPRYLSLALEFKSFDANTLLFYGVNEYTVCISDVSGTYSKFGFKGSGSPTFFGYPTHLSDLLFRNWLMFKIYKMIDN